MSNLPCITLNRYAQERAKRLHPWVFSNEISDPKVFQRQEPGSIVDVLDSRGEYLGTGFVNPKSLIAIRIFSRQRGQLLDAAFFEKRLRAAITFRELAFGSNSGFAQTYRAVFGESDGLPGLVIDRFGSLWVLEPHALGMQKQLGPITEALKKIDPAATVVHRSDNRAAQLEGMAVESGVLCGTWKEGSYFAVEDGIRFPVDPLHGQKTGFFFDQRANRSYFSDWVRALAQTQEVRVLDVFCHAGAWGLRALKAGAKEVVFVDRSKAALDGVRAAAREMGVEDRIQCLEGDGLEILGTLDERSFHAVALDPPALIPNKKSLPQGSKNYRALNHRAMQLVKASGVLSTSSCSYHLDEERFEEIVAKAVLESGRQARVLQKGNASPDHPFLPGMKEGRYLKNLFLWLE
jgi:23S rRNA (cytosine1962-C5)-methyltransferase